MVARLALRHARFVLSNRCCSIFSAPDDLTASTFDTMSARLPLTLLLASASRWLNFAIGREPKKTATPKTIENMNRKSAYCQSNIDRMTIDPVSEMTSGSTAHTSSSQNRSTQPLSLLFWLTSEPPNLLEWKNMVSPDSLANTLFAMSRCIMVSSVHIKYSTIRHPIISDHSWLRP